jgi:hypothetical protein
MNLFCFFSCSSFLPHCASSASASAGAAEAAAAGQPAAGQGLRGKQGAGRPLSGNSSHYSSNHVCYCAPTSERLGVRVCQTGPKLGNWRLAPAPALGRHASNASDGL